MKHQNFLWRTFSVLTAVILITGLVAPAWTARAAPNLQKNHFATRGTGTKVEPQQGVLGDAMAMANALVADPSWVTSSSFLTTANAGASDVFSTPLTFFPTGGDGDYVALSNGLTSAIPFPATFADSDLGGGNVRGDTDYDVTIWQVGLSVPINADCLSLDVQFLSEEFPTYVGGTVNDAFVAELDTSDWTTSGSDITAPHNFAYDSDGNVISVNSTGIGGMSGANGAGTAFDGQPDGSDSSGGGTVLLHVFSPITSGAHTVYFSIFDQGDQIYDSAVFLDNLRLFNSGGNCQAGAGTGYVLNLNYPGAGSGAVTKDPDQQFFTAGTVVTLTATADVGSTFVSWGGDLSGNTNPIPLTMDSDKTVDATFDLSASPEPNIDVSVTSLSATLQPNMTEVQTFEICNTGTLPLTYTISEIPFTGLLSLPKMGPSAVPGSAPARNPTIKAAPRHAPGIDSINPAVSEFGLISWSVDGLGTTDSAIIQVEKPANATVRGAYMAASSSPGVTTPDGAITINGSGVTWDASKTVLGVYDMTNTWADLTSIVKPIVDAAPAGRVDLTVVDGGNTNESMSLIVIFDDPNQIAPNSIILMMGAQAPAGDTFQVGLANPIDKNLPGFALDMSLGIAFSYQVGGGSQYSLVDVNGLRLTTSAGGSDDAAEEPADGNLATTGGLDDSNANPPDPYAPPADTRSDDELYTLVPFVNNGDTSITVFTQNPSNDDNIYFTGFFFGATTASVGESIILSPVSAVREVGAPHTATAYVQNDQGDPVAGRLVTFNVTAGPNTGQTGTDTTDSNGEATFTYSSAVVGADTLLATADKSAGGTMDSNPVSVEWQITTPSGIPWLDEIPTSGTVLPGECAVISVTFDSTGLTDGIYTGTLQIASNDPDTPVTDLPVTLTVITGYSSITVSVNELSATLPPTTTEVQTFEICNTGNVPLTYTINEIPGGGPFNLAQVGPFKALYKPTSPANNAPQAYLNINGDPIVVAVEANGQMGVWYQGQEEYYSQYDKGSMLFLDGSGYDFGQAAAKDCQTPNQFTPVTHTQIDPWTIETVYDAGGLARVTQTTEYVNGQSYYKITWRVHNTSGATINNLKVLHGGDTTFQGNDSGRTNWDPALQMVYIYNEGFSGIMGLYGDTTTPVDHYFGGNYSCDEGGNWYNMVNGSLPDTVDTNFLDAGYSVEWDHASLGAGEEWVVIGYEKFTEASWVQVYAPAGQTGNPSQVFHYTFVIQNLDAASETYDLSAVSSSAWAVSLPGGSTVTVASGATANVQVDLTGGSTCPTSDNLTLTATAQSDPTHTNSDTVVTTIECSQVSGIPWLDEIPTSGTVLPGECAVISVTFDSTALADGTYTGTLQIVSNDPVSPIIEIPVTLIVDGTAPAAPVILTPAEGSIISGNTPTISGTAEPGSTVTVMEGLTVLCTAVTDVSGNWSCIPTTPLSEGAHTIDATATDEAGNVSDPATRHFTVDTLAPATPVIVTPAEGSIISDNTPTISGTAEPGSTVTVMEGLTVLCTAVTDVSGNWSCIPTTPLSEGAHTIDATAMDEAGNVSDPATRHFTVDTLAPATPVIVTPAEGSVISDNTPTISGTAEPGSAITVMEGLNVLCTAVTDVSGNWSCVPTTPLSEGAHTISATAMDEAGNVSDPATRHFTVDTLAPAAPVIVTPVEGSIISDNTPTISGTAEPGSAVTVMEGLNVLCTAVTDVSGNWSCVPTTPLSEGAHTISATAMDEAGNVSDPATRHFTVDTLAPAAPVILTPAEGAVVNDNTPTISGTAEPGSAVTVMEGLTVLCTAVTDISGNWSCVPTTPLSEGAHTISATATDEAGNVSDPATRHFTVDTLAPAAPVIVTPAEGSIISDNTPTISGNAESGSTVTVMEGLTVLCTAVTNSSGIWSCVPTTPLSEGAHTISATATDEAGNVSDPATRHFTVDTLAPAAPVILTPAEGSIISDNTPTISGTAEPGSAVTVMEGLTVLCTAVTNSSGIWSCVPTTPLSEGAHTIDATATDEAGNVSDPATRSFTIQITLPDADLSASISAVRSVVNITYTIVVRNDGPSVADGAVVSATFAAEVSDITWTCTGAGGAVCGGSGSGFLYDTLSSLPVGGSVTYVVHASVMLALADCAVTITPPASVNDPNLANNRAFYHINRVSLPYLIKNRVP